MAKTNTNKLPGQVVLVMQGGGALGAFQAGVYEGMHEAGIEPDWVVGTSIGAINGAIIAGNKPEKRLARLRDFWELVASAPTSSAPWSAFGLGNLIHNLGAVSSGIPGFFTPPPARTLWLQCFGRYRRCQLLQHRSPARHTRPFCQFWPHRSGHDPFDTRCGQRGFGPNALL